MNNYKNHIKSPPMIISMIQDIFTTTVGLCFLSIFALGDLVPAERAKLITGVLTPPGLYDYSAYSVFTQLYDDLKWNTCDLNKLFDCHEVWRLFWWLFVARTVIWIVILILALWFPTCRKLVRKVIVWGIISFILITLLFNRFGDNMTLHAWLVYFVPMMIVWNIPTILITMC